VTYFCALQDASAAVSTVQGIEWTKDGREVPRMDLTTSECLALPCLAFRSWTWSPPFGHSLLLLSRVTQRGRGWLQFLQAWVEGVGSSMEAASGWWAVARLEKLHTFLHKCLLLLCTDRPDCVDGRLSFIFYSHLKNMKEIYVTSPVDRKGQAVKGQVSNQSHWLFVSSTIIIAFTVLLMIISEHQWWLFFSPVSLGFAFHWLNPE